MDKVIIMKRLLIYLTYDRQNIIDDYIGYFLRSMRPISDSIAVVCNMPRIEKGFHNLSLYADSIHYRENKGLDCGGFKDALCDFIGWEQIKEYDEVILTNDSFYGPFDDMGRIFSEMESRHLDFWGLMKRGRGAYGMTGKDPEHILSFFYAFQSPMIHSREFRDYWERMPYYKDYMTVVKQYERKLTKHFSDLGYTYDTYADTDVNESENPRNQFFQCDYLSYEMMAKRKFPFLKRRQISSNTLFIQTQENLAKSIAYVAYYTDYDVKLIWTNLIRTAHPALLQRSLGLQFILDGIIAEAGKGESCCDAVICVRVKWVNAVEWVCEYLEKIRDIYRIRIYAENRYVCEAYRDRGYGAVLSQETDMEILCWRDMDRFRYVCLIHDCDVSSEQIPSCTGKSYLFNVWENLIKDAGHIGEVVKIFSTKPYIGMLMHPVPIFSTWIGEIGWDWERRYEEMDRYISKLGLYAVRDPHIAPVHVTNNFWVRTDIIESFTKKINLSGEKECIPTYAYDYLWNYVVQDCGYLTGIVESTFYASMNEANYQYYLQTLLQWFRDRYGRHGELHEFKEIFRADEAADKCRENYKRFYVYGTGELAERCFPWIKDAAAFIVSDGQQKGQKFHDKPVMYLSELKDIHESGLILCLSKENQRNVAELLHEKGIGHYYTIH